MHHGGKRVIAITTSAATIKTSRHATMDFFWFRLRVVIGLSGLGDKDLAHEGSGLRTKGSGAGAMGSGSVGIDGDSAWRGAGGGVNSWPRDFACAAMESISACLRFW